MSICLIIEWIRVDLSMLSMSSDHMMTSMDVLTYEHEARYITMSCIVMHEVKLVQLLRIK